MNAIDFNLDKRAFASLFRLYIAGIPKPNSGVFHVSLVFFDPVVYIHLTWPRKKGTFSDNGQPFTDEDRKCNATALHSSFGGRRTAIGGRSQDKEEF